jgi:putative ABC transport system permease protein
MLRQKTLSIIKIGGLAMGVSACILIGLYIRHETNYDKHYTRVNDIYRLSNQWSQEGESGKWTTLQGPLKEVLEDNIPEMEQVARIVTWSWGNAGENHIRRRDSKYNVFESGFIYADPELLEILEIPLVYGTKDKALESPNSMIISMSIAQKYFPNENPVGKQMVINDNPRDTYTIDGVMEDFPSTSHFDADFILTLSERKFGPGTSGWCCGNYVFYTRLTENANKLAVEEKCVELRNSYVMDKFRQVGKTELDEMELYHSYYLQPISNIYLNPDEVYDDINHGSAELIFTFGIIAIIILLLACVNFINLSTAKSAERSKEVGLRKVVGSKKLSFIYQYLSESTLYSLIAVAVGIISAWFLLPLFDQLADKSLSMPLNTWWFLPLAFAGALVVGLLSGLYPAFFLSRFKPVEVLKGRSKSSRTSTFFRSSMVVFQFSATVILLIGAIVLHQQFQLIVTQSPGFDREHVINVQGLETLDPQTRLAFRNQIINQSDIQHATLSDYLPVSGSAIQNRTFWIAERRLLDPGFEAARWSVDEHYLPTLGMEVVAGRNFTNNESDKDAIIINEQMVRAFGLDDPLGVVITDMFDNQHRIIGVVKDFYFRSMFDEIRPLAMALGDDGTTLSVKTTGNNIDNLASIWEEFQPNQVFRYTYMDQRFAETYETLIRAKTLFLVFAAVSVLIACLGLFALTAFMIEQRSKEVSIRKVLGASATSIFTLLTVDYLKLVMIAIAISIPIGWYFMDDYLGDIANRIDLSWMIFVGAGTIALIIAFTTISFDTIRAVHQNPAEKLRSE